MGDLEGKILHLNIDRFKLMLEREEDEGKRSVLRDLLSEMQAKLRFLTECEAMGKDADSVDQRAARQRIAAAGKTCATMASSCQSAVSRTELLMLARRYRELANTHCPRLRKELIARWERSR